MQESLTPLEIVRELDKYIVGQADAKKNVAIALRNRWRRTRASDEIRNEIVPNNILMIGSTGVGKTEIARRLARIAHAPFVKVEASKFTEVGYVGRDVESMVRDLAEQTVRLVKQEKTEEIRQKAADAVEEIILDILIPPMRDHKSGDLNPSDEEVQNENTRSRFREKLRSGELDNRKIEIQIQKKGNPNIGVMGAGPMDESTMLNLQEMLGGMLPKTSRKRKMTISDARKALLDEEIDRLIDMEEVKDEAIRRAEQSGIIFIDEIDKIASSGGERNASGGSVSREGVQRDLLPVVEGCAISTKYGTIHTEHILFIAAGAFHFAKPSDLIPELQGRFPIRVELENLRREDFIRILSEPQNSLIKQYKALFRAEGVELDFNSEAIEELAETAITINEQIENIGARRLHTIMSQLLNDYLYNMPENLPEGMFVEITKEFVQHRLQNLVKNRDLSHYIL